ncbi:hypothetical protein CXB51_008604 [Gossypium anomalum]|uniref:RRM domain-containing protein n=1 Tax=Gossypium anomalum TaxID=47600 RepID=A0A8J5YXG9_9ROSI|nr:hypothetical protein CXB51_008604 [Gossypium anomalum]
MDPITVFVNNIPVTMHWKGLWALFSFHGAVKDAFIPIKKSKFGRRFGFVRHSSVTDAQRAIDSLNGFVILGYRIGVKMASFRGRRVIWRKMNTEAEANSKDDQHSMENDRNVSEKGVDSNSLAEDSPKNRKFLDSKINQARVVQGFVEEELLWKLQRCLVGESATVCDISSMVERLTKFGLGEISLKRIQGRFFLLEVPDVDYLEVLEQNDWAYLKECFISIEPWSKKRFVSERVTWIKVAGIPLRCWNYETFKRVAELWGKLICMGESWNRTVNFEKMEMLISVNKPSLIDELAFMEVGNCKFPIRIKESGTSEWKCEKFLDGRGQLEEKRGESPEVESGIRSESGNFSEERRNDMGGALNAISLEEGVIEKDGTGSSAEGIMPEEHFFGNNENISIEGVDIGVEVDRAKEDGLNMGLFSQVDLNVVSGQHLSEDPVAGCTSKSGQHLRSGSNPSESNVEGTVLGGKSVDISNRRRVILREAKKTWEVGKMLRLSVRGDEEEIIDEISRLEGQ